MAARRSHAEPCQRVVPDTQTRETRVAGVEQLHLPRRGLDTHRAAAKPSHLGLQIRDTVRLLRGPLSLYAEGLPNEAVEPTPMRAAVVPVLPFQFALGDAMAVVPDSNKLVGKLDVVLGGLSHLTSLPDRHCEGRASFLCSAPNTGVTEPRTPIEDERQATERTAQRDVGPTRVLTDPSRRASKVDLVGAYSNPSDHVERLRSLLDLPRAARPRSTERPAKQAQTRLDPEGVAELVAAYTAGGRVRKLATQFGIHRGTVHNILKRQGVLRSLGVQPEDEGATWS